MTLKMPCGVTHLNNNFQKVFKYIFQNKKSIFLPKTINLHMSLSFFKGLYLIKFSTVTQT